MYHIVDIEKEAKHHILVKCSECSYFGIKSNLLKVATRAITHLAMTLDLQRQEN